MNLDSVRSIAPSAARLVPAALALLLGFAGTASAQEQPPPQKVESLSVTPSEIRLGSPYAYAQIVATAYLSDGASIDATRLAEIKVVGDAASITAGGIVEAGADGSANITVTLMGKSVNVPVVVSGYDDEFKPDYVRDVMPVVSRLGCNAGTCHGAKDGKNGFKLSLRGYDPIYDIRAFTDDLGARRVNVAAPDSSLMLLKATGAVPHEGGGVTKPDSDHYGILRAWIAGGAKLDLSTPKVTKIEVFPVNPVAQTIGSAQQMRVVAHYADGKARDVTREAYVESGNGEVAEPVKGEVALIKTLRRGEAPILVRFEGNYAATTVTVMGDRSGFVWEQPPANSKIDELVAAKWQRMKILPSGLCDDYEFIRRACLDLTGLPPSPQEVNDFVADKRPLKLKRDALIDKLVGSEEYVDHWANKWADMLMVNSKFLGKEGAKGLRDWIRNEVRGKTPYDEFVRKVITAGGSNKNTPPASYFKILREPDLMMENTTHLFLATRFNCNKCHDHPFERWTQDQYYELAAFFAQVELKGDPASGGKKIGGTAVEGAKPLYEIVSDKREGEMKHERTGAVAPPTFPYPAGLDLDESKTRREKLAGWITSPENRYFASSYANRLWGYMLGTGIIEPLDDIRAGNPASNPDLLAYLEREFIDSGFDIQHMLKLICKSRTYQLTVATNKWNADDTVNFSHAKARRLPAEVLYDTIYTALGAQTKIPGVPPGTRAAQLPDVGVKLPDGFLDNTGRPVRESSCECERSTGLQLGPIMALVSGPTVGNAISDPGNILPKLVAASDDDRKLVNEIFLRLLARPASEDELAASAALIGGIDSSHAQLVAAVKTREAELKAETDKAAAARAQKLAAAEKALADYHGTVAEREAKLDKEQAERVAAAEQKLKDYQASVPQKVAQWAKSSAGESSWQTVTPVGFNASTGSRLELENDNSIYASGNNGKGNYQVFGVTDLKNITGVRIEALPDDRLPKKGPGRADSDGNFVLTEFEMFSKPAPAKEDWKVVKLWGFDKPGDAEGWPPNQLDLNVEGGALKITSKGADPNLAADVKAPAGYFVLEMKATFPGKGKAHPQLFWTTKGRGKVNENKATRITVARGGKDWTNYRFHFETEDELASIRLDPLDDKSDVYIDALRLIRADSPKAAKLALDNAKADFSQGSYPVASAVDGKRDPQNNGWAIAPQMGVKHTATFEVKTSPQVDGLQLLHFHLDQQYQGNKWNLGRFRLSVTDSPKPINFGLPENIKGILAKAEGARSKEENETLKKFYLENNSEMKSLQDAVATAKKPRDSDPKLAGLESAVAEAKKPLPADPALARLRADIAISEKQLTQKRLVAAQDIAWAVINTPAFLFNR